MKQHKCIITGIGRSGTTFLVQLLTRLGLDTGFNDPERYAGYYVDSASAGLETNILREENTPYFVKDPRLCDYLPEVIASDRFVIDHAIVPIRDLDSATQSRLRVNQGMKEATIGGFFKTTRPHLQRPILAETFYRLMQTLTDHDVPFTTMAFPRLANDAEYTFRKLAPVLGDISRASFLEAFEEVANPKLIHDFSNSTNSAVAPLHLRIARRALSFFGR